MTNNQQIRVLSGIQPSGQLHLGNYFGMMARMIEYQTRHDLFAFIVNYHALTTIRDGQILKENTFHAACDFLALGLDPERATFWIQSDVPEVTELTWLLSNLTGVGLMERSTSYKDKIAQGVYPNMGLFSYPILMAADILCFGAQRVPVGKDQKQHLEIARDIAQSFNHTYGELLVIPKADLAHSEKLVPGIDGRKMSKSYGNTISIFGDEKALKKRIMSIVTDSTPVDQPKDKDTPLFVLSCLFLDKNEQQELAARYDKPGLKYGEVKKELLQRFMDHFQPYRQKRDDLVKHPSTVWDILDFGAQKARRVAREYLEKVRTAMGLNYRD